MLSIFINAATATANQQSTPSWQTLSILGQEFNYPFFLALPRQKHTAVALESLLCQHIYATLKQAKWDHTNLNNIPILLASSSYHITHYEAAYLYQQPIQKQISLDSIAHTLRQQLNTTQIYNLSTACTSSAQAIVQAAYMLHSHFCKQVLIVGFEAFNLYTFAHFQSMNLLSQCLPYLPMIHNNGLVLGEGIACLALSTQHNERSIKLSGISTLTNTQSFTNSDTDSLTKLIQHIIRNSQLDISQIDSIKIHGTGGQDDTIEKEVLATLLPNIPILPCKAFFGHTLGASGAIETAWLYHLMQQQQIPLLPSAYPSITTPPQRCLNYFLGFGGSYAGWIAECPATTH